MPTLWCHESSALHWPRWHPSLCMQVSKLVTFVDQMPAVGAGFWVLLMVLPIIAFIPISLARAHKDLGVGILFAVTTLFMGGQPIFATMLPAQDLSGFWKDTVGGYVKVALVTTGAMVLTGCLVYVKSAHDTVRSCMADILRAAGQRISR